ncbi:MAG: DUF4177 domain-containing protein [Planctomycetota bacterium]
MNVVEGTGDQRFFARGLVGRNEPLAEQFKTVNERASQPQADVDRLNSDCRKPGCIITTLGNTSNPSYLTEPTDQPMANWEYKVITTDDLEKRGFFKSVKQEEVESYFNSLGDEGWEIVNVDFTDTTAFIDFRGVAKRPKQS